MTEITNFETYLDKHGKLIYTNVGVSMLPLLRQGKDLFVLVKKQAERAKIGDVVLYKRNDKYVLHRIIDVRSDDYVILGDNCTDKEYGIKDSDILAIMTGFIRNGREHSVNEFSYRMYSFIWLRTVTLRIFLKKSLHLVKAKLKTYFQRSSYEN